MPKQEYQILGFHGGINDNSDPKDISDIELREADGVSIHKIGRLVNIGNTDTALAGLATSNNVAADIEPGYGLYYFSTDYENGEANTPEDWLAIYDKQNSGRIRFYYSDKDGASPALSSSIVSVGAIKPNFYYSDGQLRIGDASHSQPSKWFGYIDSSLFWTSKSGQSTNLHDITRWQSGAQEFKSLEVLLGDVDRMFLFDASAAGPTNSTIHATNKQIVLSYWTNSNGDWNGNYQFGATPIYMGNQEGPITPFQSALNVLDTVSFYDNEVIFQVHVSSGENKSDGITADANHRLGDDRIIGINFYFREQQDNDWTFLMNTDLKEGGKHYWGMYNSNTESTYGIWDIDNNETVGGTPTKREGVDIMENSATAATHIAFSDAAGTGTDWEGTGSAATQAGKSFSKVDLRVILDNNNINGFGTASSPRKGFLRVWGGAVSPLYVGQVSGDSIDLLTGIGGTPGTTKDTYYIPMYLPALGTDREFKVEVLDENFTVIADSGIFTMTIEESNKAAPDDYDQDQYEDIR